MFKKIMQFLQKRYECVEKGIQDLLWLRSVRDSLGSSGLAYAADVFEIPDYFITTRYTIRSHNIEYSEMRAEPDETIDACLFVQAFLLNAFEDSALSFYYSTPPSIFRYITGSGFNFGWHQACIGGDYIFFVSTSKDGGSLTKKMTSLGWESL